ncbi:hypothetical protein BT96DRAFT_1049147 [Gymnopus androsaceus JB14]|uniref:Uncharacterized protein n=1 Tax=Gymnopus androsaceus JB14 TaxID=1447944 RepID=A0A6A4H700_9AGAR|nr:hypothetical protein BT96DRAFT_1049147 [Gymnopus androsaceus JB14]
MYCKVLGALNSELSMLSVAQRKIPKVQCYHCKQQKMLNPVFPAAHMRDMIPAFFEVTHKNNQRAGVCVKRSTLTLALMSPQSYLDACAIIAMNVLPFAWRILPEGVHCFILNLLSWTDAHQLRGMSNYMYNVGDVIFESKKLALEKGDEAVSEQIWRGKDLISIFSEILFKPHQFSSLIVLSERKYKSLGRRSMGIWRIVNFSLGSPPDEHANLEPPLSATRLLEFSYDELIALPYLDGICQEISLCIVQS